MTAVFVPGVPAPQGSKRHVGNGRLIESSKRLKPWRETVTKVAQQANPPMLDGPVVLGLEFVMPRPKATPKTKPTPPAVKRPDIEKLARAIADALTGVTFADDSQVVAMPLAKRIADLGEPCGVHIEFDSCTPEAINEIVTDIYRRM
ncbi:RusA family crossover junction endodeoxyribonuclease [Nocardia vinacea]|uniref:RusA family crossover junction endodeoxyribonuclease n=1 Tax=Nocardia vinacea TaxID=96468 RepID=UPI0033F0AF11